MWVLLWAACGLVEGLRYEPSPVEDDFNETHGGVDEEAWEDLTDHTPGHVDDDGEPIEDQESHTWYPDLDGDGYAGQATTRVGTERPADHILLIESQGWDCDDDDHDVHPDATEVCGNGIDEDCDGADEDGMEFYADEDGDGYGDPDHTEAACSLPDGFSRDDDDCDDDDPDVNPAGEDVPCDGVDGDCDGLDAADTWYADRDGDSYPSETDTTEACTQPSGYLAGGRTDCDDTRAEVNPAADEVCGNGLDDDCDGDEDQGVEYYEDADEDGFSDGSDWHCDTPGSGWLEVETERDCDDQDATVFPGATEVCGNAVDEDCDARDDTGDLWYGDVDGDGYTSGTTWACTQPSGYLDAEAEEDCDDEHAAVHPGAAEVCGNGVDDDCDDEGLACGPAGDMEVADGDFWLSGESEDDHAGSSVAGPGDVDGDGQLDLLIGAYGDDTMGPAAGAAYLLLGPVTADRALGDYDALLLGMGSGDAAGSSLAASDLDGDGYGDLVVGAGYSSTGATYAGSAYVLYGPVSDQVLLDGADAVIDGNRASTYLGSALALAGDQDSDGVQELLVGARADAASDWAEGRALLFSGLEGSLDPQDALVTLVGQVAGDEAGFSVDGGHDVDGDGFDELFVGAPEADGGKGFAYLIRGPVTSDLDLVDADLRLYGSSSNADLGQCVRLLRDQDGDGLADLAVSAPRIGRVSLGSDPGDGDVDHDDLEVALQGNVTQDYFGQRIEQVGDVNGDRATDLVVSSEYRQDKNGGAWLFHGPLTASVPSSEAQAVVTGDDTNDGLEAAAGVGDLDDDGLSDLLLGVPGDDEAGSEAGGAVLFLGGVGL